MKKNPKEILEKYWGFSAFRGSQEQIIDSVLENQDVLALLPTGGGKSICYQIPGLVKDGICIVVSPLVALIQDQVASLNKKGIKAIALTGGISTDAVINLLDNCLYGNYKFLYVSPERLQQEMIRSRIEQMNVNLLAIDEAHCISQWGNDFRPAYLKCAEIKQLLPNIPVIALTATATKRVVKDIADNLQLKKPEIFSDSFARNNITFKVYWEEDKKYQLKELCKKARKSVIVYVRTRRLAQELFVYLNENNCKATFFHGGVSKKDKSDRLNFWLENKVKVMVATNAFGMGIDKPDVQLVVHYQIPDSIENYFQEAGRAGRDGKPAAAILLTNKEDENQVKKQFISILPNVDFVKFLYNKLNNYFQIPYGMGNEETYQLNFNAFCDVYKLNTMLTYNGLRVLDQNSVIALSESFSKKTTVQFSASKHQLFSYLETNQKSTPVVQTILRTYGGIFEYETKINTLLVARKANVSEKVITALLEQLEKDQIITYTALNNDIELTFLVPREDDRTINTFAKKLTDQQQVKIDNIKSMLAYVKNHTQCRTQLLLAYFGEKEAICKKCDICLQKNTIDADVFKLTKLDIIEILAKKAITSRALIKQLPYKKEVIIGVLQHLLEEEIITVNTKNEYELR